MKEPLIPSEPARGAATSAPAEDQRAWLNPTAYDHKEASGPRIYAAPRANAVRPLSKQQLVPALLALRVPRVLRTPRPVSATAQPLARTPLSAPPRCRLDGARPLSGPTGWGAQIDRHPSTASAEGGTPGQVRRGQTAFYGATRASNARLTPARRCGRASRNGPPAVRLIASRAKT